jgi:mono/diheme cytochrome c family protein
MTGGLPGVPECRAPVETSEYLPARNAVISADIGPTERKVLVSDMFGRFNSQCGACHVSASQGDFRVSESDFFLKITDETLERMQSDDPLKQMPPPPNVSWSSRQPGDPIIALANDIKLWIADGKKPGGFYAPLAEGQQTYTMSPELGESLTNIGNCLPNRALFSSEREKMLELDDLFQSLEAVPFDEDMPALPEDLIGLPKTLNETDLFTLDSEVLARHGVVAFAPGYPLWSDNAGKLRHVRVPAGETIQFDKERQEFEIPANTRFYKTFLKEVKDDLGETRFRKIETRIIVSRPDIILADGKRENTSLFGVYKWDDTETRAELVGAEGIGGPFRNGRPFADLMFPYVVDEAEATKIVKEKGKDEYFNEEYEFDRAGIRRHYAIPSSKRCIECHTGSPSANFVLGFTPMQIRRRECSKDDPATCALGGVIEPTGADELTQLERLIDIGLISGMDSVDDVKLLEEPQADRAPRNEHELLAQGYLLGNCSHCHNPNGFASSTAPELAKALDFLPRADGGGIFQFPLDRMSERSKRDPQGKTLIPYITPSLRDRLPFLETFDQTSTYSPKFSRVAAINPATNVQLKDPLGNPLWITTHMPAPWRSLLFRNTHTPYTYLDDFAVFPHMPLNTPGYDCRASQLLGDWMVSIPAVRKQELLDENYVPNTDANFVKGDTPVQPDPAVDREPQPYVEVLPGAKGYEEAKKKALARLEQWHKGDPYNSCPTTEDIIDPSVVPGVKDTPADRDREGDTVENFNPLDRDGVPDHAHWIATDITEPRGDWLPRNSKWADFLIKGPAPADPSATPQSAGYRYFKAHDETFLRNILVSKTLAPIETFLKTPFPFTLWVPKPECDLSGMQTVASLSPRPLWVDRVGVRTGFIDKRPNGTVIPTKPPAEAAVYSRIPGSIAFDLICRNCHGRQADSKSSLADTILFVTGGVGRVANFRNGLFGPLDQLGANRERVFGNGALNALHPEGRPATWPVAAAPWPGDTRDWTARYMAWMGLGGTEVRLPQVVLDQVGSADVVGFTRSLPSSGDANMLSMAISACSRLLGKYYNGGSFVTPPGVTTVNGSLPSERRFAVDDSVAFIEEVGDLEFWLTLCSLDNPSPIRGFTNTGTEDAPRWVVTHLYDPAAYPAAADVANHERQIVKYGSRQVVPSNLFPYCYNTGSGSAPQPHCPPGVRTLQQNISNTFEELSSDEVKPWILRGAVNVGFAAFVFIDLMSKGDPNGKLIRYDECELLPK